MKSCEVVVVEDEPELGDLVVEILSLELDCDVRLFTDGSSALEWLRGDLVRASIPTLMVLDINLPGASGLDILDFVKSQSCFDRSSIIMTSSDAVLLERARDRADWLLLKPVAVSHFVEISRWFKASVNSGSNADATRQQPAM